MNVVGLETGERLRDRALPALGLVAGLGLLALMPRTSEPVRVAAAVTRPAFARGAIVGTVVDSHGDAVPGARVVVLASDGAQMDETRAAASSEDSLGLGEFRVDGLPPGTYQILASLPGADARVSRVPVSAFDETRVRVRLDLY